MQVNFACTHFTEKQIRVQAQKKTWELQTQQHISWFAVFFEKNIILVYYTIIKNFNFLPIFEANHFFSLW
jgi:hypothetical protein